MKFLMKNLFMSAYGFMLVLIIGYASFIINKKYESKSILSLKDSSSKNMPNPMLLLGLANTDNNLMKDVKSLESFIQTEPFYNEIDSKFNISEVYKDSSKSNFYEKLSNSSYKEEFLEKFASDTTFYYDVDYNVIELSFESHDAEFSKKILDQIILSLEKEINKINARFIKDELTFIQEEAQKNLEKLEAHKKEIIAFQDKHNLFNPQTDIEKELSFLTELEGKLLSQSVEYSNKKKYMNKKNPELIKLRNSIYNLKKKHKEYKNKLLGDNKLTLNNLMSTYSQMEADLSLKSEIYKQSVLTLESLKIDAIKKNKVLEIIVEPRIEERPLFPNLPTFIPIVAIFLLIVLFLIKSILSIIEDHKH